MKERRMHERIFVKDGVFAVIAGKPHKVIDICVGGASFYCTSDVLFDEPSACMQLLVMNGNIYYIQDIKHSVIASCRSTVSEGGPSQTVRVSFGELTAHQTAQFQMLLGLG